MGNFIEFADVLARRMREEILSEMGDFPSENPIDRDFHNSEIGPSLEETLGFAWLLGNTERTAFTGSRGKTAYGVKTRPRRPHSMNSSEREAYCYFQSYIEDFSEGFSLRELKSAFRGLARRLHPDMGGTPAGFIRLRQNYEILAAIFARR